MTTTRPSLDFYLAIEYPYVVVPDDGSWFIRFPDLPGCMTQVEDPAEIGAMADEIRVLWLETTYEDGRDIPEPTAAADYSGKFVLRLPKHLHRDLAEAAERNGVSLNAYVTSLLAERHGLQKLETRLAAIEARLETGERPLPRVAEAAAPYRS